MPARSSLQFSSIVRAVNSAARGHGLRPPTFRSPPQVPGAARTIRRWPNGAVTVAVAFKDRPWAVVVSDCIEGTIVANDLSAADALRARTALWAEVGDDPNVHGAAA
ncbi:MAG: hypothetical protein M3527_04010 [Actinomycetota bacterium]|nr:hypothetical protein [Acidimicrobiia bacterium]MDQ3293599.1 hypothetical protein [Actinomycetota bacterium]